MQEFEREPFYAIGSDDTLLDEKNSIYLSPTTEGQMLVAQYYAEKYGANIVFPKTEKQQLATKKEFCTEISTYLSDMRKKSGNFRQTFILGTTESEYHAASITYIKENGRESLLFVDSLGDTRQGYYKAVQLLLKTGMRVYATPGCQQADDYSCYSGALIVGRETTGINRTPNLLSYLEKNSTQEIGNYYVAQLPPQLLKTPQRSKFFDAHYPSNYHPDLEEKIHKNESITAFRKRYTQNLYVNQNGQKIPKKINSYLRKKGIKFADMIEIQFYLNRLKEKAAQLGIEWSNEKRTNFVADAKAVFKLQPSIEQGRAGLHELAIKCWAALLLESPLSDEEKIARPPQEMGNHITSGI